MADAVPDGGRLLTGEEVAAWIGVHAATLRAWRRAGRGPPWVRLGERGPVRYRRADVEEWINGPRER